VKRHKCKRWLWSGLLAGIFSSLALGAFAGSDDDSAKVADAQLPVWTDELGDVPLEKYTREELDKMVGDYWTPERLKNATPLEPLVMHRNDLDAFVPGYAIARKWEPSRMLSKAALPQAEHNDPHATPTTNLGTVHRKPFFRGGHNQYTPYATPVTNKGMANGKIYFRSASNGQEYHCSGSAINSSSKQLIATAAHCIHGGPGGTWHYNIRFTPNYHDGSQPNGQFQWSAYNDYNGYYAWMPQDWIDYGQLRTGWNAYRGYNSDFVFITTNNNANGQRVVDAVGGHGLWTHNGGPIFDVSVFGYPGNINDGQTMQSCWGVTNIMLQGPYAFSAMYHCNFGAGASGGPWLDRYDNTTGIGQLRTVTSFLPPDDSNSYIAGPLFHSDIIVPLFHYANLDSSW